MANNTLNGTSAGLPGGLYIFLIALNIFLSITATLGNALILVALGKISSIYPPTKLLFRCLAVTDLCVGLLCQPLDVFFILADFRHINYIKDIPSVIHNFFVDVFFAASALTSAAISVDRLLALLLGVRYRQVVTLCRVRVLLAWFWFFGVSNASLFYVAKKLSLSRVLSASNWTFLGLILLSIIISTFSYSKIFFTLRHQQAQVQGHVQPEQSSRVRSVLNIARYKKTVYSVAWIQFAMLACYGPYTILGSVSSLRGYSFEINIANEFCFCLLYLNSCLNPVLYCWKIRDVKQEVKKTIGKFLCFWFFLLCLGRSTTRLI